MDLTPDLPDLVPPACGPTLACLQAVLDGEHSAETLDADPHALACPTCRERIRAARLVLAAFAAPEVRVPLPSGLTSSILAGVRTDRAVRLRRRAFAGSLAVAAAVLVAVFLLNRKEPEPI